MFRSVSLLPRAASVFLRDDKVTARQSEVEPSSKENGTAAEEKKKRGREMDEEKYVAIRRERK